MKRIMLVSVLMLIAVPAFAQTANEIEAANTACTGVRRACTHTPAPAECTKARIDNCKMIEDAWNKLQADRRIDSLSKSIDGIAEQLKQKAKP